MRHPASIGVALFYMYIVKLYKQHKGWCAIVILFAFGQLFINYKNGVMCSPFYNYDMYSYPTLPHNTYEVVQIAVNAKLLQPKNFSPQEWDNIVQPVYFFDKQQEWNSLIFRTEVQKFLHIHDSALFINVISQAAFNNWYTQQVLRIAGIKDKASIVEIRRNVFLQARQY